MGIVADNELSDISHSYTGESDQDSQESSTFSGNNEDVDIEDLYESDLEAMDLQDNPNTPRAKPSSIKDVEDLEAKILAKELIIPMKQRDRREVMKKLLKESTRTTTTEYSGSSRSDLSKRSVHSLSTNELQANALNFSSRSMHSLDKAPVMPRKSSGPADKNLSSAATEVLKYLSGSIDARRSPSGHLNPRKALSRSDHDARSSLNDLKYYSDSLRKLQEDERDLFARPQITSKELSFAERSVDTPLSKPERAKSFESTNQEDVEHSRPQENLSLPIADIKIKLVKRKNKTRISSSKARPSGSSTKTADATSRRGERSSSKSVHVERKNANEPDKGSTLSVEHSNCKQVTPSLPNTVTLKKVYTWYTRLGQPNKTKFKAKIASMPDIDITENDVDVLPWVLNGTAVNVARINAHLVESIAQKA